MVETVAERCYGDGYEDMADEPKEDVGGRQDSVLEDVCPIKSRSENCEV